MKKRIHINKHQIKHNAMNPDSEPTPVITVKTYKSNDYGHQAVILDDDGNEVARVVYSPDKPLSCGARVWIETHKSVEVLDGDGLSVTAIE